MRTQLLTFSLCCLLLACSSLRDSVPPVFTGKAAIELPVRIQSYSYPAYRQGVQYKARAQYLYDSQNRLIRVDSLGYGQRVDYQYTTNRLNERLTYQNGLVTTRTQFVYNAEGQLEKTVSLSGTNTAISETTHLFDDSGQLVEQTLTALPRSNNYVRTNRYTWQNGNMVARVELDGQGQKRSEWSYTYDQQPNYRALLPVDPTPDEPRTYNNQLSGHLEKDYTGLIDLCVDPFVTRYQYRTDGLPTRWETNGCSVNYNEIEYEAKQ